MANANINALYAGTLRIKYHISFLRYLTFYKWCVTKVAHCIWHNDSLWLVDYNKGLGGRAVTQW